MLEKFGDISGGDDRRRALEEPLSPAHGRHGQTVWTIVARRGSRIDTPFAMERPTGSRPTRTSAGDGRLSTTPSTRADANSSTGSRTRDRAAREQDEDPRVAE